MAAVGTAAITAAAAVAVAVAAVAAGTGAGAMAVKVVAMIWMVAAVVATALALVVTVAAMLKKKWAKCSTCTIGQGQLRDKVLVVHCCNDPTVPVHHAQVLPCIVNQSLELVTCTACMADC